MKMEKKCLTRINPRWLLLCALVLVLRPSACRVSCPSSCKCMFSDVATDSVATCDFGNSTLNLSWEQSSPLVILNITCQNSFVGQQYECSEFPHYNYSSNSVWLKSHSCPPAVLRCTRQLFNQSNFLLVKSLNVSGALGPITAQDLAGMSKLQNLHILLRDDADDVTVPAINSLPTLVLCTIEGGRLRLSPDVFHNDKLFVLELRSNKLAELPPGAFSGLSGLGTLTIINNFIEHLGADSFKGLPSLYTLVIKNSSLTSLDRTVFHSLKLRKLHIIANKLRVVPNGLFTGMDKLFSVRLMQNQEEIELESHAFANMSARYIEVSDCGLKHLPEGLLSGSTDLAILVFKNNQIEELPPGLIATNKGLLELDVSHNKIKQLPQNVFAVNLFQVNVSYNLLTSLEGNIFRHSSQVTKVSFNNNRISHVDLEVFNGTSLWFLSLAHNKLKRIAGDSPPTWTTRDLNLSHNELVAIDDWMVNMDKLVYLDLSHNNIEIIKESHIHLNVSKLIIDLRHNKISKILKEFNDTQVVSAPEGATLYLSNNPLDCDCAVTTFLQQWHQYGLLADYEDITCSDNEKLSNLDIHVQCNKSITGAVISSVVGTIIGLSLLVIILKKRHSIWTFLLNIFTARKSGGNNQTGASNETLDMDGVNARKGPPVP